VKLLLDTHALLWFLADDPRLSEPARTTIEDPVNPRLLSPVFGESERELGNPLTLPVPVIFRR
jgi:hypothetical protein